MPYKPSAILLMTALAGAWLLPIRRFSLWSIGFIVWLGYALFIQQVSLSGALGLGLLVACCWAATNAVPGTGKYTKTGLACAALLIALLLATHRWPGFNNPLLLSQIRLSADAAPFTLWLNFDKAAAGFLLLTFFCRQDQADRAAVQPLLLATRSTILIAAVTIGIVMALGVWLGQIHWEPKWPRYTPLFLIVNLLFACLPEEVFFRAIVQNRLQAWLAQRVPGHRYMAPLLSVLCSTALFALAHMGANPTMLLLIGLAGLGYGITYAVTRRLGATIFVHVALNAVHFIWFTYPGLATPV